MKKRCLIAMCVTSLFSSSVFSYVGDKSRNDVINCPNTLICSGTDNCLYPDPTYWGHIETPNGMVANVIYGLSHVYSSYHSPDFMKTSCHYTYVDPVKKQGHNLYLYPKDGMLLEVFYANPTTWNFNKYDAECIPGGTKLCPLKIESAFGLYNANVSGGILFSVNENQLPVKFIAAQKFGKVNYDTALTACGGTSQCTINITSANGAIYGSVTVDMNDKMKILQISSTNPSAITISQIASTNSIGISYPNIKSN